MRLSDELFRMADSFTSAHIAQALAVASAGRMGLFPSGRRFALELSLRNDMIEVDCLECTAITRDGTLIEAHWDTNYTGTFDTRVVLPKTDIQSSYFLTIEAPLGAIRTSSDGYSEPAYTLVLRESDSALPDNALPIAHIVYDYAWRIDDLDFVPPCLYVSSHPAYVQLLEQFSQLLNAMSAALHNQLYSNARILTAYMLPTVRQLAIRTDKERDLLTPMSLLGMVQQCVSAFATSCELSDVIRLENLDDWLNYAAMPYSVRDVYTRIKEGLNLCANINQRLSTLDVAPPPMPQRPTTPRPEPSRPSTKRVITIGNVGQ